MPRLCSLRIGAVTVDTPVVLAPMSGVTDRPFRQLVRRLGGQLVVSEMIASHEMVRAASATLRSSTDCAEEHPMAVQLAGHDPQIMAEAARLNVDRGAALIDINFGCPAKKVVTKLAGSALMREVDLSRRIVDAVVRAVPVPVTVKMRLGWDAEHRNAPTFARMAEEAGARWVTVHGRTRCQLYNGTADWRAIAAVKSAVTIPVIANGDIAGPSDIDRCLAESGADGVMIGRGAQGRPWILAQAIDYLTTGRWPPDPPVETQHAIVRSHYDALLTHYGQHQGVRIARKHLAWYAKALPAGTAVGAARYRAEVMAETDPQAVIRRIDRFYGAAAKAGADTHAGADADIDADVDARAGRTAHTAPLSLSTAA